MSEKEFIRLNDVNHSSQLVSALTKILPVKNTTMREVHAKSMGFKSNNALCARLKKGPLSYYKEYYLEDFYEHLGRFGVNLDGISDKVDNILSSLVLAASQSKYIALTVLFTKWNNEIDGYTSDSIIDIKQIQSNSVEITSDNFNEVLYYPDYGIEYIDISSVINNECSMFVPVFHTETEAEFPMMYGVGVVLVKQHGEVIETIKDELINGDSLLVIENDSGWCESKVLKIEEIGLYSGNVDEDSNCADAMFDYDHYYFGHTLNINTLLSLALETNPSEIITPVISKWGGRYAEPNYRSDRQPSVYIDHKSKSIVINAHLFPYLRMNYDWKNITQVSSVHRDIVYKIELSQLLKGYQAHYVDADNEAIISLGKYASLSIYELKEAQSDVYNEFASKLGFGRGWSLETHTAEWFAKSLADLGVDHVLSNELIENNGGDLINSVYVGFDKDGNEVITFQYLSMYGYDSKYYELVDALKTYLPRGFMVNQVLEDSYYTHIIDEENEPLPCPKLLNEDDDFYYYRIDKPTEPLDYGKNVNVSVFFFDLSQEDIRQIIKLGYDYDYDMNELMRDALLSYPSFSDVQFSRLIPLSLAGHEEDIKSVLSSMDKLQFNKGDMLNVERMIHQRNIERVDQGKAQDFALASIMLSSADNEEVRDFFFRQCFAMSLSELGQSQMAEIAAAFSGDAGNVEKYQKTSIPWLHSTDKFQAVLGINPISAHPSHLWNHK